MSKLQMLLFSLPAGGATSAGQTAAAVYSLLLFVFSSVEVGMANKSY